MSDLEPELEPLLDEAPADRPPPVLVPWGWRLFFLLLAGFDVVCLLIGRVPWSGGKHGLDRADTLLTLVVGLGVGIAISLLAEALAADRAREIGLRPDEARLVADELSILTRPSRAGRASIVPLIALVWIICTLFARFAFRHAALPSATVFLALHALTGLALPVLWRTYQTAHDDFQAWLDDKSAPFDPEAAERAAAHRARVAEITRRIRRAEDELRERLDKMPRVAPPLYLAPKAMWVPLVLALLLDLYLLFSPDARAAALAVKSAGPGRLIWSMLGLWVEGCVLIGIVYALVAWYYVAIADQASRRWSGRDWSGGLAAIAVEIVIGGMALALLLGLVGWHARFVLWNVLIAAPLLIGVLADIRDNAAQHHERSTKQRLTTASPAPNG